ncbi:mucin TcMUCII, putative, partial [Trypanosoma cruzi marinkellei]
MMTTCRLLYALLVLALCCCPSVCGTASSGHQVIGSDPQSNPKAAIDTGGKGQPSGSAGEAGLPGSGPGPNRLRSTGGANLEPTTEEGQGDPDTLKRIDGEAATQGNLGPGPALPENQNGGTLGLNTGQEPGGSNTGETSSSGKDTVQNPGEEATVGSENKDGEEPPSGTSSDKGEGTSTAPALSEYSDTTTGPTSTEQVPSGSVNPMAQIGTTGTVTVQSQKETVPNTTTTTGAPSRLPEIDGSLSSSAWVC